MENGSDNKKTITVTTDVTIDVTQLEDDLKQYLSDQWNDERPESPEEIYKRAIKDADYIIERSVEDAVKEEVKKRFLALTDYKEKLTKKIYKEIDDLDIVRATSGLSFWQIGDIIREGKVEEAIRCSPISIIMTREERLAFYKEASERLRKRVFELIDELKNDDPDYVFEFFKGFTKLIIDEK